MENVFTVKIGKKELSIRWDKDEILQQIEQERTQFEEKLFLPYWSKDSGESLSEDEYNENLNKMVKRLEEITEESKLQEFIENARKKNNGTFYKRGIVAQERCENTIYICEWHNTWIYNALKVFAEDDLNLRIRYMKIVDTPG